MHSWNLVLFFYVSLAVLINLVAVFVGVRLCFGYVNKHSVTGPAVNIYRAMLLQLFAIQRHPHLWAKDQDELMTEFAKKWDRMKPARYALLIEALQDRRVLTNKDLRPGENDAANAALSILRLIVLSAKDPTALSNFQLIGVQAPVEQAAEDESITRDAI